MGNGKESVQITDPETGEVISLNATSLVADVRDRLLDKRRMQTEATVWDKLKEHQQRAEIDSMTDLARQLVFAVVDLVATQDKVCAYVEIASFAVDVEKGEAKITSKGKAGDQMLVALNHAKGKAARITIVDSTPFNKDERPIQPDADQPSMFADEDEEGPQEGDQLADGDDDDLHADSEDSAPEDAPSEPETGDPGPDDVESETSKDTGGVNETPKDQTQDDEAEPAEEPKVAPEKPGPKSETLTAAKALIEKEGQQAKYAGEGEDACPYDGGEEAYFAWIDGYRSVDDYDEIEKAGYDARDEGMAASRNPYKRGDARAGLWLRGYDRRKSEEPPIGED